MRKSTLLFAAAMLTASSAFAFVPQRLNQMTEPTPVKGINCEISQSFNEGKNVSSLVRNSRDGETIITEAPEGEVQSLIGNAEGFYLFWGIILDYASNPASIEVVTCDNGEVYIKDIETQLPTNTYVKGVKEGNTVTVQLPQCILAQEDEDGNVSYFYASVMEFIEDEEGASYYNVAAEDNKITYTVDEDGTWTLNLNEPLEEGEYPKYIIGLTGSTEPGESMWTGYGDAYQVVKPYAPEIITMPEDAEVEEWAMISTDYTGETSQAQMVSVAFYGDKFYLCNLDSNIPDYCLVGDIEGDKIVIKNGQDLGYLEAYGVVLYGMTFHFEDTEDGLMYYITDDFTFKYDKENKTLTTATEGDAIVINAAEDRLYYLDVFMNPIIRYQTEEDLDAPLLAPVFTGYSEYDPENGEGRINFDIPALNEKNAIMPTEYMYYNFFVDGELTTLYPDEFERLEEEITDIPYNFTDSWDIGYSGAAHYIYFKWDGVEEFGVQSFFDNGTLKLESPLTTYKVNDGIHSLATDKQAVSTTYTNLLGIQVNNPANGIYVKTVKYADGTTASSKVALR